MSFGHAPVKTEGKWATYSDLLNNWPWPRTDWTYVEVQVPVHLEDAFDKMFDQFMKDNWYEY